MKSMRNQSARIIVACACLGLLLLLLACSSQKQPSQLVASQPASSSKPVEAPPSGAHLTDADLKTKTPQQLAAFVFENHGCKNCHTLGENGKMGFTERGKQVGKNFEGCIRLLTSMNVIAMTKEENRTADEKQKAARFEEFGCSTCHQITPGKLGLTSYGAKLASLHLACTDVQKIVASKQQ